MPRSRLYIFDMGNVVSTNNDVLHRIAAHLNLTPRHFYDVAGEDATLLMTGKITTARFWERLAEKVGSPIREDLFARYFHPTLNQQVIALVEKLKQGARVVVGTNTIETHYHIHLELGQYDLFDRVYPSHRMGLVKPDPRFYRYILESEARDPAETVFIDDLSENVDSARRLGIHAILFTDAANLYRELRHLE